jgi:hypothetical protein
MSTLTADALRNLRRSGFARLGPPLGIPGALIAGAALALIFAAPAECQRRQEYVAKYDAFIGYTFLNSPKVSLFENGVHMQVGIRPRTWYSLGFDYSIARGDLNITPDLLLPGIQQTLSAQLGQLAAIGRLPAGYKLAVTTGSRTQTFAAGPQLAFRRWSKVTLLLRPSMGLIAEVARPKPSDAIATGIVAQLAPHGEKTNRTPFFGVGGGVDFMLSKHVAWRVQADFVYDHLFDDLLRDGRMTTRFSIGPAFNFGKNVE